MTPVKVEELVLPKLFEEQVERSPDAIALEFEGQVLTYAQLNQDVNVLAHYLHGLGVKRNQLIGICLHRSVEMVVALLAVLKTGAAYLPIDPTYPRERVAYMVSNSHAPVILTERRCVGLLPQTSSCDVVLLDAMAASSELSEPSDRPIKNIEVSVLPDDLAYTIYTSGSTGNPKGVQIRHGSVTNLLRAMAKEPGLNAQDRWLAITSISFDIAVLELFLPLVVGATVVLLSREIAMDGPRLAKAIAQSNATIMQATPATWRLLLAANWAGQPGLRVLCGGEAMTRDLADMLLSRCEQLWNMYGPTETTVWSMVHQVQPGAGPVSIGHAIANTTLQILVKDSAEAFRPAYIDEPGELYIGGAGVALGYFNRPDLTDERFIENPFGNSSNLLGIDGQMEADALGATKLYKTGDLVRLQDDGIVGFIGRVDSQVKIRGFRVELGEVESALLQSPAIHAAAAVARSDHSGELQLIGYVVPTATSRKSIQSVSRIPSELGSKTHLEGWKTLWNDTYNHHPETITDCCFDFSGYGNSYTGQLIDESVMREWTYHTVERIQGLKPKRVLEIGCGKGLLLFRVAPQCESYVGLDITAAALEHIQLQFAQAPEQWSHVALFQAAAHELDDIRELQGNTFDTIVINSVIQYFPSTTYLLDVLTQLQKRLSPGGKIFIGDVRHLDTLPLFHASVQMHKTPCESVDVLHQSIDVKVKGDRELVIDPQFFTALQQHLPGLTTVSHQLKRGEQASELTDFRYDVVLHFDEAFRIDATRQGAGTVIQESCTLELGDLEGQEFHHDSSHFRADMFGSTGAIREWLRSRQPDMWDLYNVPNARLAKTLRDWQSIQDGIHPAQTRLHVQSEIAIDPEALWQLADELPYQVYIRWSANRDQSGTFDVRFQRGFGAERARHNSLQVSQALDWPDLAHSKRAKDLPKGHDWWTEWVQEPTVMGSGWEAGQEGERESQDDTSKALITQLRSFLSKQLPSYMVPTQFVVMDTLPLTPNDKVDRKALPDPDWNTVNPNHNWVAPTTETEEELARIWGQILHVKPIGKMDEFMELGGHSLLAAQLMAQLRAKFDVQLSLIALMQCSRLDQMAQLIDRQIQVRQRQAVDTAQSLFRQKLGLETDSPLETWADDTLQDDGRFGEFIEDVDIEAQWLDQNIDQYVKPNLDQDEILDTDITGESLGTVKLSMVRKTTIDHVFLTGATGLVGGFLLYELLLQTDAHIHCLVRATNAVDARYKLEQYLEQCHIPWQSFGDRIHVLPGDLERPLLGLDRDQFDWLAHHVDSIYHSGAQTNQIYPYQMLRAANVQGTVEVLRLASTFNLKSVHHLSTLDVLHSATFSPAQMLDEDMDLPPRSTLATGYARTKWVAERLVATARDRGIPTHIYRLGMTTGHSISGYTNHNDMVARLLRGLVQMQVAPTTDFPLSFTPADQVAKALVTIAMSYAGNMEQALNLSKTMDGATPTFHSAQTTTVSLQEIVRRLQQQGYVVDTVSYEEWLERLYRDVENPLYPFLEELDAHSSVPNFFKVLDLSQVSNAHFVQQLQQQGMEWAEFCSDIVPRYIQHLVDTGHLPTQAIALESGISKSP